MVIFTGPSLHNFYIYNYLMWIENTVIHLTFLMTNSNESLNVAAIITCFGIIREQYNFSVNTSMFNVIY